jgi:hypothetical protein
MNQQRWNRLYSRMNRIVNARRRFSLSEQRILVSKWLRWAERVTGNTCFFMSWD